MPTNRAALAPFVLPVLSCLVVLVAIAIAWIVRKALAKAEKKPAKTAPSASESPEASIQPPEPQGEALSVPLTSQATPRRPTRRHTLQDVLAFLEANNLTNAQLADPAVFNIASTVSAPPPRPRRPLSRTPVHCMTREQYVTFTAAIATVRR